jgi:undecaprenyl-diphosphatase
VGRPRGYNESSGRGDFNVALEERIVMSLIQSIILGIVQGLAEFLPISSSAHLIIVPWLLKWPEHTLTFDVALHLGTLTAIVVYFFKDYLNIARAGLTKPRSAEGRLLWNIVIATVPAGIFGILLEHLVEKVFRDRVLLTALVLILFGIMLFLVDRFVKKEKDISELNFYHAAVIGLSQALALFPGVSRSGITITSGMSLGFKREDAARFSFLLSGPVIFGAGMISLLRNYRTVQNELLYFIAGFLAAALVGFLTIHFLLNYLKKHSFTPFVVYRIALAALIAAVFLARS